MKNQNSTANTNFWKTLAIMFGIFILIAGIVLLIAKPFAVQNDTPGDQTLVVQTQASNNAADNSFDAVKDRVTEVNDNYGQNIKSSYTGSSSTMEAMAKQRMFFSGLKSTLIIVLLIVVILVVLVKGFNLTLWKKAKKPLNAGDPDESGEGRKEPKPAPKKPQAQPKPTPKKPQEQTKPVPKKTTKEQPKNEEKREAEEEIIEEDDNPEEEDVQKVTDVCQLP